MLPTKFWVNWPFGSEKEAKNRFSRWPPHLLFPVGTILAYYDLQVTPMLPTKFWVNWPFGSGEEAKNRFSRWPLWRPTWISDRNDLAIFELQVTLMFLTKFRLNWPFSSGEEGKNRFLRWPLWWISNRKDFNYFCSTSHPDASYQVLSQMAFRFKKRSEK